MGNSPLSFHVIHPVPKAAFACLALVIATCLPVIGSSPEEPQYVVAKSGHWAITRSELNAEVAAFGRRDKVNPDKLDSKQKREFEAGVLDKMIAKKLLLAEGAKLPEGDVAKNEALLLSKLRGQFKTEPEFQQWLQQEGVTFDELKTRIHDDTVIQKVLDAKAFPGISVADKEVEDYYQQHSEQFVSPPKVRASRVLILTDPHESIEKDAEKKRAIESARARVAQGEDFAAVAQAVSQDKYSSSRGGDIGFFQMGTHEKAFDETAFQTKVGELSPVFKTMVGYWFMKVTDSRPAGPLPLSQARGDVQRKLLALKKQQKAQELVARLRREAGVTDCIAERPAPAP